MKIILRIFYILRDAQNTNFTYTNYLIENKSSTILTKYFAIKQKKIFHFFSYVIHYYYFSLTLMYIVIV